VADAQTGPHPGFGRRTGEGLSSG